VKNGLTPRAPDKCGRSAALSGKAAPTADSASGGFSRQIPPLPVTPAVGLHIGYRVQDTTEIKRMFPDRKIVFDTRRLIIRLATAKDVDFFHQLWTNPQVMSNVGFPKGIPITRDKIHNQIAIGGKSEFEQLLVIALKSTGQDIGECKMSRPNSDSIATTDVKLLPAFWGNRYGIEVKRGLLDYIFTHTDSAAVEATPNVGNVASIKMQEAVGGICVGESIYQFPESMRGYTNPVHHYVYQVRRTDWQQQFGNGS
jgi:[ribosomal protein S5]-alanine N-acetyltransferase